MHLIACLWSEVDLIKRYGGVNGSITLSTFVPVMQQLYFHFILSIVYLMTTPPTTSPQCFTHYYLVVRQDSEVVVNEAVAKGAMDNRTVNLRDILNIPIITCMYTYTLKLTPVYGKFSSGKLRGNPNLRGIVGVLFL